MDPTLALDDVQMSSGGSDADDGGDPVVAGSLDISGHLRPLYKGVNVIGRESDVDDRNRERVVAWQAEHGGGGHVSVLLLRFASITSKHAIIYMEDHGHCFVEDMRSRNKTFVIHNSASMPIPPGGRYSVRSGDTLKFGDVLCTLHIGAAPERATAAAVQDFDTQPLEASAVQQPNTTASLTATASAACEPQRDTEQQPPAEQQAGSNIDQVQPAAPAAQAPAPNAATAAAAGAPPAGGSSRPSSRSSSRRTENLARPTLGFSSGDDVWDGSGEPEATSQPAAEFFKGEAQPPVLPASTEPGAAAAQHAHAEGSAAPAQPAGEDHAGDMASEGQAGAAVHPASTPATEVQMADDGAAAAPPPQPPVADKDTDSDVTRDVHVEAPPSASKPAGSAGGGWHTRKHHRQSQGSDLAGSTGQGAHASQPVDTAATMPAAAAAPRLPPDGGTSAAEPARHVEDAMATTDTQLAGEEAAVPTGDIDHEALGTTGALQQQQQQPQMMQQPQQHEQPEQPDVPELSKAEQRQHTEQEHPPPQAADPAPAQDAAHASEDLHGDGEVAPSTSDRRQAVRASVSQGVTGADVADALQMVGNLAAVFPTTQMQGFAAEEMEDQDEDDQAEPLDPAAAAPQGTMPIADAAPSAPADEVAAGAAALAADPAQQAAASKAVPAAAPPDKQAARGERQWFEETPAAALSDSCLPGSKPTSRRSSPEPSAADAPPTAKASGNGHRRPERRRKAKTPSPAADPDQPVQPAHGAQPSSSGKKAKAAAKGVGSKRGSSAKKQQLPIGRPATRSSPAGSPAPPATGAHKVTRGRTSRRGAATDTVGTHAAPSSSGRKRKAGSAEQPAVEAAVEVPAGPSGSTGKRARAAQVARDSSPAAPAGQPQTSALSPAGPQDDKPATAAQRKQQRRTTPTEQEPAVAAPPGATRKRARAVGHPKDVSSSPAGAQPAAGEPAAPAAKKQKTAGKKAADVLPADASAATPASSKAAAAEQARSSAKRTRSGSKPPKSKLGVSPSQQEPKVSSAKGGGKVAKGAAARRATAAGASDAAGSPADAVKAGRRRAADSQVTVRFSKNVGEVLKKEATQKVVRLGGSVTEEDQGFTHFVCLSKRSGGSGFQKSFAALWALAKGVPIVTEMWVDASVAASGFVAPTAPGSTVLLTDKAAEKEHAFDLAVAYQRAQQKPLLADLHGQPIPVFLTPGLLKAEKDKGKGLKDLITAAGGSIAAALSKDFNGRGGIALGDEHKVADEKRWAKAKASAARGMPLFGRSKLVTAVMRQELDRSTDVLCTL